ncbi:hypothetical protein SISNIDRAFT_447749 [Sistotremastrum niveocremeum HHB9708]|uniref:Uncharacterized protein n=1 Tax=Sistotremastrum niveocremeum HHB9708 TaxID=1314777 RepID=A0A165AFG1_9AGAM|nr:hypothetical protein SISNIDRAFT_447749 [Sistotremastrum niveocremeum HHB9708]
MRSLMSPGSRSSLISLLAIGAGTIHCGYISTRLVHHALSQSIYREPVGSSHGMQTLQRPTLPSHQSSLAFCSGEAAPMKALYPADDSGSF